MSEYTRVSDDDLDRLRAIAGTANVIAGAEISSDYAHDEMEGVTGYPEVLVKVGTETEIVEVVRLAGARHIPIVVRGSGTGLVGGAVALHGGIMIDMTRMNHIIELDPENSTITVEAGVLLMDLAAYVEKRGFFYPPDPGEKSATLGGNISTNAGGMRAVKYGVTRDYVRGLTVVLASGTVLELGGKIAKNSSGYSLKDLFVGAEGTLGIVTQAILRLLPLPAKTVSLLVPFGSTEDAIQTVFKVLTSRVIPTAVEFMERETLLLAQDYLGKAFPDTASPAYLLLTFDGSSAAQVADDYEFIAKFCLENGAVDAFIVDTDERKEVVWGTRGAFLEAIKASSSQIDECDVVVPRNRLVEFIRYTHELAAATRVRIPSFGHAGDGNLHVYLCRDNLDEAGWQRLLQEVFDKLYARAEEMRGQVSGEHGIGYAKRDYLRHQLGDEQIALMRGIKLVFDPTAILNPGKIFEPAG